jgi:hypothetical protein
VGVSWVIYGKDRRVDLFPPSTLTGLSRATAMERTSDPHLGSAREACIDVAFQASPSRKVEIARPSMVT